MSVRSTSTALAGALLLALAGCGKAPAQSPAQPSAPAAALPARVAQVVLASPGRALVLSGTVQARTLADLAFRVGGKVVERPIEVGDHVRAGQVIARLDPADLQLAVEAADSAVQAAIADATRARAEFGRYQSLGDASPAYLPSEYDTRLSASRMADARLAQSARQLALARHQHAYGALTADADGIITALPMQVGQVVTAGQTVATLAHTAQTEVVVDVPEHRLGDVGHASAVAISLWADPGRPLAGRVREIGAQADPASRTFAVRITVLDPPPDLLALGMTATVRFAAPARQPVATLPATALADRYGAPAVWVLDPATQHASLRPVSVAFYEGDGTVAVGSGLAGGEQVVTAGTASIDPAMRLAPWSGATR